MSEPQAVYYADLIPTQNELKLLARLRKCNQCIMTIEKDGTMLKWTVSDDLWEIPRQNGNGKRPKTVEEMIIDARNA